MVTSQNVADEPDVKVGGYSKKAEDETPAMAVAKDTPSSPFYYGERRYSSGEAKLNIDLVCVSKSASKLWYYE